MFFLVSQFFRKDPARIAPFSEAVPQSFRRLSPLLPYIVIMTAVAFLFRDLLDRKVDEFSAPIILPVMMLCVLLYEKLSHRVEVIAQALLAAILALSFYRLGISSLDLPSVLGLSAIEPSLVGEILWRNLLGAGLLWLNFRHGQEAPTDASTPRPRQTGPAARGWITPWEALPRRRTPLP